MITRLIPLCIFLLALGCKKNDAKNPRPVNVNHRILTQSLNLPWEIVWGPDNFIWVTEKAGQISRVDPVTGAITAVFTVPDVKSQGEGGLLGMVLHPEFSENPYVYVAYDYDKAGSYREKIVRYTYNGSSLTGPLIILDNIEAASVHNGSRLLISPDMKLLVTTGDASNASLAQNTTSLNGKILRLNLDGSIPADNPSPASATWSTGFRNPQGLVYAGMVLFGSEHGPTNEDELNIIDKGRNYGWPDVRGICDESAEQVFCTKNNVKESVKSWTPTIAASGIDFYNKDLIPGWKNSLLVATLKDGRLKQLKLNAARSGVLETNDFLVDTYGRLRDVCISPEGKVFICTSNGVNDKIVLIEP